MGVGILKKLNLRDPIDEDLLINLIGAGSFVTSYYLYRTALEFADMVEDKNSSGGGLTDILEDIGEVVGDVAETTVTTIEEIWKRSPQGQATARLAQPLVLMTRGIDTVVKDPAGAVHTTRKRARKYAKRTLNQYYESGGFKT